MLLLLVVVVMVVAVLELFLLFLLLFLLVVVVVVMMPFAIGLVCSADGFVFVCFCLAMGGVSRVPECLALRLLPFTALCEELLMSLSPFFPRVVVCNWVAFALLLVQYRRDY